MSSCELSPLRRHRDVFGLDHTAPTQGVRLPNRDATRLISRPPCAHAFASRTRRRPCHPNVERLNAFPIRMIPPAHSGAETAVVLGRTGAVQDRPPSSLPPFSGFVGTGGTAGGRRVGNTCRVKVAPARSCSATLARKPRYRVS